MIHPAILVTAFATGLLGSVHCIGMCGGIVGSLNAGLKPRQSRGFALAYNTGRILSYTVAGVIAGFAGSRSLGLFSPEHAPSIGTIVAGAFMVALGLYIGGWWRGLAALERGGAVLWRRIAPVSQRLLPLRTRWQALAAGALWGWLPCGLVYASLAWSLSAGSGVNGGLLMAAFGLGTLPMLLALGWVGSRLDALRRRPAARQAAGALIASFGILTFLGIVTPIHAGWH